jgi:hypothetical protein
MELVFIHFLIKSLYNCRSVQSFTFVKNTLSLSASCGVLQCIILYIKTLEVFHCS